MNKLLDWFDDRTGIRKLAHEALYERIPGGARWRYVWGSTLVIAFFIQMVTGICLWMAYSPSALTAWESVYYIDTQMAGGWLLRGIHHYTAQVMIVLLVLHLLQIVIDGAYRAPREINFWLGLVLMQIVLGLSLTGYLLPWDQKGYWATRVATNLLGLIPGIGAQLQQFVVGGSDYGHHTLTRFFALHAGILPGLLIAVLVIHIALFRRHGIHAKNPTRKPDQTFWPDQVLKDAVAGLAVLAVAVGLSVWARAELGAPADPASPYDARPEWYFLFLFQFLKYFPGRAEVYGALVVPAVVMGILILMPIVGHWKLGHRFNVVFLLAILCGATLLTAQAIYEDHYANWHAYNPTQYAENSTERAEYEARFEASKRHQAAVEQAEHETERVMQLARIAGGIPPSGALTLVRNDPKLQGPKLFQRHCASCHSYVPRSGETAIANLGNSTPTAPNLFGFASRDWIAGLLDPQQIASQHYFGYSNSPFADGDMVGFVTDSLSDLDAEGQANLKKAVAALSAEASLPDQAADDKRDAALIAEGRILLGGELGCADCHKFHKDGILGSAPDLTGYGSRQWLRNFISNPSHLRFYRTTNDRMPAFAPQQDHPEQNQLDEHDLGLLVDWLRGDWPEEK